MATVLITGGTGLIGKALSHALTEKGYNVIILTRNITGKKNGKNIRYAAWNVKKQQVDTDALLQADHIIHLAGAGVIDKEWTDEYKKKIIESRTKSSSLLIETLKKHDHRVKTFTSAGAIGWYGADKDPVKPFTETDVAENSFLGHTCKLWEQSVEPVTRQGTRLVILRIGIVLSDQGGALTEFKRPIRFGAAAILGSGKQVVSWIHIDDLCRLLIYALENENLAGVYNAVAPEPVSNKKLTLTLARAMKKRFYIPFYVPSFILKLLLGQRSIEVLKSATVSSKKITEAGFIFRFMDIAEALGNLVKTKDRH